MPVLITTATDDPYLNLAIENWIFKEWPGEVPRLMLWQNSPALVIGRAQNPWLECNLAEAREAGLPVVRRQSGGGTVYHDPGNINFTFLMPNTRYNKVQHLTVITRALARLGLSTRINARQDIVMDSNGGECKLSGSAYRETRHRSFHHGTLLVNANLDNLVRYLHHPLDTRINAKGVASVRARVTSLVEQAPHISVAAVRQAISEVFCETYHPGASVRMHTVSQTQSRQVPAIQEEARRLKSWEWIYGKTLPFHYQLDLPDEGCGKRENAALTLRRGCVESYQLPDEPAFARLAAFFDRKPALASGSLDQLPCHLLSETEQVLLQQLVPLFP